MKITRCKVVRTFVYLSSINLCKSPVNATEGSDKSFLKPEKLY